MKNLQILMMCCFLVLLTACGREGGTAQTPVASEEITESITQMPDEQESEAMPENMELGLTVNGVYYPIPISLKQLTDDGWKISGQTPYFLEPFVGEEYYETRADWSLSKDGQEILPGGSIIRLLEKDGVLLEVTITNQVSTGSDTASQKIEDGVVDSMVVFYDEKHTSIKLDNQELNHVTQDYLIERYPSVMVGLIFPTHTAIIQSLGFPQNIPSKMIWISTAEASRSILIWRTNRSK